MRIFITGVHGFLGSAMARHFAARGHTVAGSARNPNPAESGILRLALGESPDPAVFAGIDVVVHGIYDRTAGIDRNIAGTLRVFDAAREAGVARQVFVSSYSARPDAISAYGKLKFRTESEFLDRGRTVVRPGLVLGNGGMFGRLMASILRLPVVPLLDGGRQFVPVIGIGDFVSAMAAVVENEAAGSANLFYRELTTMRALVEMVKRAARRHAICVPVPVAPAAFFLEFCRRLRIPMPADPDNIRSLQQNQAPIHASDLARLLPAYSTVEEAVAAAVAATGRHHAATGAP